MELNLKRVQEMDSKEIYDCILPTINNIYQSFKYVGVSWQDYYDLVLREINNSKMAYNGVSNYSDFIKNNIIASLSNQVRKLISDSSFSFNLISEYMDQKFGKISNCDDALNCFKKLDTFFKTYNFIPNPDLLIELINKKDNFKKMTELIFNRYNLQIISGDSEKIFDNESLISTIETYCMFNGVEIKQDNYVEFYDANEYDNTDIVNSYFKDIRKIPLLSVQQERELAQRIAHGDSEAKDLFIESNLRLVVSVAKKYLNRGLSFLDLIQEGNLGLINAVDRYDVEKGYRFSTYATWYIKQTISRAIENKSRNIRVPVHVYEKIMMYRKVVTNLETNLHRKPTIAEVAKKMKLSVAEVTKLQNLQNDTLSINSLIGNDKDTELEHFIPVFEKTLEDVVATEMLSDELKKLFQNSNLKQREIEVLILRYGFNNGEPMTLGQIGNKYSISSERVRQIEEKAIIKIRNSNYIKQFADYMQNPEKSLKYIEQFRVKNRKSNSSFKSYLKDNEKSVGREKVKMRKLQTIYQYFSDYTREQVDEMLSKLTDDERALITMRYGDDLDNPVHTTFTAKQNNSFYGVLVPYMKSLLEDPNNVKKPRQRKKIDNFAVSVPNADEYSKLEYPSILVPTVQEIKENIETNKEKKEELNSAEINEAVHNDITKNDCTKMLELLRTPTFTQMMSTLTVKESIIVSLRLGYVDGKCFSTESIAQFLGIEEKEVTEATKKVLLLYKDNINSFLDSIIERTTEQDDKSKTLYMKK